MLAKLSNWSTAVYALHCRPIAWANKTDTNGGMCYNKTVVLPKQIRNARSCPKIFKSYILFSVGYFTEGTDEWASRSCVDDTWIEKELDNEGEASQSRKNGRDKQVGLPESVSAGGKPGTKYITYNCSTSAKCTKNKDLSSCPCGCYAVIFHW